MNLSDAKKNPTYDQFFSTENQNEYIDQIVHDKNFGILASLLEMNF